MAFERGKARLIIATGTLPSISWGSLFPKAGPPAASGVQLAWGQRMFWAEALNAVQVPDILRLPE